VERVMEFFSSPAVTLVEVSPMVRKLVSITAERLLGASCANVWSLWTTRRGLESWWSPEGFMMKVTALEARVGGPIEFRYEDAGSAGNSVWRGALQARGLASSWTARGSFLKVDAPRWLAFRQALDFGSNGATQEYRMTAEFRAEGAGTHLIMTAEATPSKHWDLLGRTNLEGQLDRLAKICQLGAASPRA
jgi:uncharacterized protein YndB with AHSA1/START domain